MTDFLPQALIKKKRDGQHLDEEEVRAFIAGATDGSIPDYQVAAMLMAIYYRGLDGGELSVWADAMLKSGDAIDLSSVTRPKVDKHSTGGVGDKITLPLTPLIAACGAAVPQLSGRGLGHTGGTLDKLESIPGWRADVSYDEMIAQLEEVGAVICAAGSTLAPADKKLYALRDVTGTVESIPLIASSIMSKKIAEGVQSLVLDVKCGTGAFMKDQEQARALAEALVSIGRAHGVRTSALLTDMSVPLGRAAGNALEVTESLEVLRGGGPDDVVELTLALATEMLAHAGLSEVDPEEVLASGRAYETWCRMIAAQGGDPAAALPRADHTHVVAAPDDGVVTKLDAYAVGVAAWRLGAGRSRKEDVVQHGAGVLCLAKPGERVAKGDPLMELHTDTPDAVAGAVEALDGAIEISDGVGVPAPLVLDTVR